MEPRSDTGPFVIIPVWLLHSGVSDGAIRQYAVLARYADRDDGVCWPSRERLAEEQGCSLPTVKRRTKELIDVGALRVDARYGDGGTQRSNLYTVIRVAPPDHLVMGDQDVGVTSDQGEVVTGEPQNQSHSEPEEPAPRSRRPTERDNYFDVLVTVFGQPTRSGAAFYAKVVTEVMEMPDASPDELMKRALVARQRYGKKATPGAVTKNWPLLGDTPPRAAQGTKWDRLAAADQQRLVEEQRIREDG